MSTVDSENALRLDLERNRTVRKYPRKEQIWRVLWMVGKLAFVLSPRPMFGWRRLILRAFGASVGAHVNVYPSTKFYMPWNVAIGEWSAIGEDVLIYSLGKVTIGSQVTISYRSHICAGTHDFTDPSLPLVKPAVVIKDKAWVGTDAFIGPSVTVGAGAIVGARAVVVKDVEPLRIVAGNPARVVGVRPMNEPSS